MSTIVPVIAFPEIESVRSRRPKTLIYLIKLLYGSGTFLAAVYAVAILLISPLLDLQFERRIELLRLVNDKLRLGIYSRIVRRLKEVPNVVVKYGDKFYSDASFQTDDNADNNYKSVTRSISKNVRFEDEVSRTPIDLDEKLQRLKESMLRLNITDYEPEKHDGTQQDLLIRYKESEMQPLNFQLKLLQSYLDSINEKLFTRSARGYDFFQQSARTGKPGRNIMVDLRDEVKELRRHALKNY